ncbi:DNA repair protein RecN [Aquabacterium humicola]|uniref:DNA repair protein RecN n=1 Tax=Aquabacterium humicola TaxID=3237377 RepID=UPI0025439AC1|nr:DNA repair protein RecN [Rubrivivax pictus]
MLRRLALRDFVIVPTLELEFHAGFSVLTGETGAGKSILIDALQLALGSRGDAGVVREGAPRAEVSAEFDALPSLAGWLDEAGFAADDTLLLRRTIDAQGKSRAWINGSPATIAQLRELADALLDIHGQHAWQGLTRPAATRELLDGQAGIDTAPLAHAYLARKAAADALQRARERSDEIERERERLAWQIGELDKLAPGDDEWTDLSAEHQRLSHAQALIDAARGALDAIDDGEAPAAGLTQRAIDALADVVAHDARLQPVMEVLQGAMAQLQDAAHSLNGYLGHAELDPDRLAEVDARLAAWLGLARRYRRPPEELPALLAGWRDEQRALDAATDTAALEHALATADARYLDEAKKVSAARRKAAAALSSAVTQAMQTLGMAGGRFEVTLPAVSAPQSFGMESVEFTVAGHAGSTPRPLAKVASGGELSRLALAIAVTTVRGGGNVALPLPAIPSGDGRSEATAKGRRDGGAATLIFDEIDAGIGGAVGDTVGALMKQLGRERQVLAVTHLAQVAACADQHYVVSKSEQRGHTTSDVQLVAGESRVAEIARMLGGEHLAGTSLAHAQALLGGDAAPAPKRKTKA